MTFVVLVPRKSGTALRKMVKFTKRRAVYLLVLMIGGVLTTYVIVATPGYQQRAIRFEAGNDCKAYNFSLIWQAV